MNSFLKKIKFWKIYKCLTHFVWDFQIFKFLIELVDSEHISEKVKFWKKNTSVLTHFVWEKLIFQIFKFLNELEDSGHFSWVKNICPRLTDNDNFVIVR